jgi:hypothetical protein
MSMCTSPSLLPEIADMSRITAKTDAADMEFYEAAQIELGLDSERATQDNA